MEPTFSPEERELLLEILEEHHRELLREIARTKHHDFKSELKKKERLLESIVHKMEQYHPAENVLWPV
jgi:hypothetical protein